LNIFALIVDANRKLGAIGLLNQDIVIMEAVVWLNPFHFVAVTAV
jgi:hypothetical protein